MAIVARIAMLESHCFDMVINLPSDDAMIVLILLFYKLSFQCVIQKSYQTVIYTSVGMIGECVSFYV
jgi:hypothetical protein